MKAVQKILKILKNERKTPKLGRKLILVILHSIFLIAITIALQYTSLVRGDELGFLKWISVFKHNILNSDPKPFKGNVVFIDVGKDLSLAEEGEYDSIGPGLAGAKKLITDRFKLAKFFSLLNNHSDEYRFILCDILFEDHGPGDETLKLQLEKTKKIITTSVWEQGNLIRPIFKVPSGVVNYTAIDDDIFTKMPIFYKDTLASLPTDMCKMLLGTRFTINRGVVFRDGNLSFNTIIPEFYYRKVDLIRKVSPEHPAVNTYYLGQLLYDPNAFKNVLRDKFIIIGDFSSDIHSTYLEKMPGALILWDTFLTLHNRETVVAGWLSMLFIFYFLLSYWIFVHPERKFEELHERIHIPFFKELIVEFVSFIGVLIIVNVVSYAFFGAYISLFYIATYLTILQITIDKWPKLKLYFKKTSATKK